MSKVFHNVEGLPVCGQGARFEDDSNLHMEHYGGLGAVVNALPFVEVAAAVAEEGAAAVLVAAVLVAARIGVDLAVAVVDLAGFVQGHFEQPLKEVPVRGKRNLLWMDYSDSAERPMG